MLLLENFWTKVTTFCAFLSFPPLRNENQTPFTIPDHTTTTVAAPASIPETGPIFQPPGVDNDSKFECKYPLMVGWESCSTPFDRKCWLRHNVTGKRYDINTNYEDEMPTGIVRRYNITLDDSTYDADGMPFTAAKLFRSNNHTDKYPGPWIQACWGDTVIVNVTNNLKHNGTSVHWHGIRQNQTMHMDGVNGVTQCPIAPGDYFVYNFTATQYGSSWYHSHYSAQYADGAVGPMTLHGPTSTEWDEAVSPPLIMTDWGHSSAFVSTKLDHANILLNGRGNITRTNPKWQAVSEIQPPYQVTFEKSRPGQGCKKYLMRIINTSFSTTFVFSIDNHMLQVVSADFVPIQPYKNQSILVGIGQRYNVIVEANPLDTADTGGVAADGNYWIRTEIANCFFAKPGASGYERTGILRYDNTSTADPTTTKWSKVPIDCRDEDYEKLVPILPWQVGHEVNSQASGDHEAFDAARNTTAGIDKYPLAVWSMAFEDDQNFRPLRVDYSDPTFFHLDQKNEWPSLWNVVPENYTNKDWIYLVIKGKGGNAGAHPMHLHGHDFALLEQAYNKPYNASNLDLKLNNPPRRDVVLLPTSGYIVIAFKADNPGAWLVHCHIATHIAEGLGLQIMEDQSQANAIWPKGNSNALKEAERVCKNWNTWYNDTSHWAVAPDNPLCKTKDRPEWCFQDDSGV